MSASPARRARRECQRRGHAFVDKTDGTGQWITLPCQRCGAPPPSQPPREY